MNASHVLHTSATASTISHEIGTSSSERNALNLRGERFDLASKLASGGPRCHSSERGGLSIKSTPSTTWWGQPLRRGSDQKKSQRVSASVGVSITRYTGLPFSSLLHDESRHFGGVAHEVDGVEAVSGLNFDKLSRILIEAVDEQPVFGP